jgi:hypothetical protein
MDKLALVLRNIAELMLMGIEYHAGRMTEDDYRSKCESLMKQIEEAFPAKQEVE